MKKIILIVFLFQNCWSAEIPLNPSWNAITFINAGIEYNAKHGNTNRLQFSNYQNCRTLYLFGFSDQFLYSEFLFDFHLLSDMPKLEHLILSSKAWNFTSDSHIEFLGFDYANPGELSHAQWDTIASLPIRSLTLDNIQYLNFKKLSFGNLVDHPTLEMLVIKQPWLLSDQQFQEINGLNVHLILEGCSTNLEQLNLLDSIEGLSWHLNGFSPEQIEQLKYVCMPSLKALRIAALGVHQSLFLKGFRVDLFAPHLVQLDLRHSNLTGATINAMKDMHSLQEVWLGNTKITSGAIKNLSKLPALKLIELSNTTILGADFSCFKALSQLETLNLSGTNISRADLQTLENLTQLKSLDLRDLKSATVRPEDVQRLKEALPNCIILN